MKILQKSIAVILLLLMVVFAAGCGKDNDINTNTNTNNNNSGGNNNLLVVETVAVTDITLTSVKCGGIVKSDGGNPIIERGVCWSTGNNPSVSDARLVVEGDLGSFDCLLTGLDPNTTYYLKAYAINGSGIGYGSAVRFTTLEGQPSLYSPSIAVLQGEGYLQNGDEVVAGVEYSFGFIMASNPEFPVELSSLLIKINDDVFDEVRLEGYEYCYVQSVYFTRSRELPSATFTAIVTDVSGASATASFTVSIEESQPLVANPFEWYRFGATPGVGLEEFGLEWNLNSKDIRARIRPMGDVLLFMFEPWVWYDVTTEA